MTELSAFRPFSPRDHWPLLPILLLATFLRLWQIDESLWLDELHTAWVVSSGPTEIAERARIGNQSPLYFYLLWATNSLFGMSEQALRLPSLAAGVGLVALAYWLAYQFTRSPIAAGASALLAALDHNFLFYATEARPYACVQLLAAAQLSIFWKLQTASTTRRRIAFVVSSVGLFYLHYTAILLVAGEVVYSLTRSWCRRNGTNGLAYTLQKFTIDLLCVAAMTLPTAAHLVDIGTRRNNWASFITNTSLLLPVNWFSLVSYVAVPFGLCLIGAVVGWVRRRFLVRDFAWQSGFLLACWLGVPLAIVWLLTITKFVPLYLGRYIIGAALAPMLFAGLCVGVWHSKRSQLLVAGLMIVFALCSSGMIEQLRSDGRLFADRRENWRDAVAYVNANWLRDEAVFVRSGLLEADQLRRDETALLREYCVSPLSSIYQVDPRARAVRPLTTSNSGRLTREDIEVFEQSDAAWFLVNGTAATRERCVEQVLESVTRKDKGGVILFEQEFGLVGAYLIVLYEVDDRVTPPDDQPTSPNSIAPP